MSKILYSRLLKQILDLREDEVHGLQVFVQPFHKQAKGLIAGV